MDSRISVGAYTAHTANVLPVLCRTAAIDYFCGQLLVHEISSRYLQRTVGVPWLNIAAA